MMTKAIILFLALLLNSDLYSQVPKNHVTLEGSTGTWDNFDCIFGGRNLLFES
ncbi:MAG: hypothetical protein P8H43_02375 [Crocinitomicaceae bacterium]|nr:hypothetical protein [Crocinitomicaceae bacterium]